MGKKELDDDGHYHTTAAIGAAVLLIHTTTSLKTNTKQVERRSLDHWYQY
jgi:hypothetical protein